MPLPTTGIFGPVTVEQVPIVSQLYVVRLSNNNYAVVEQNEDGLPGTNILTPAFPDVQQAVRAAHTLLGSAAQGAQEARLASLESIIPEGARGRLVQEINGMLHNLSILDEQARNYGTTISRVGSDLAQVTGTVDNMVQQARTDSQQILTQVQQAKTEIEKARADLAKDAKGDLLGTILGGVALAVASYALFLSFSDD